MKEINQKTFESLCAIQCTIEEVCSVLDIDEKTLGNWCRNVYGSTFSTVFAQKRLGGKASLRRNQWKLAETNATMGIWLGKQFLGQRDIQEIEVSKKTSETIESIEAYVNGQPTEETNA